MSPPRSIPSSPRKFFLGLRWKVVLGISLTLIPLVAFLTLYARASLLDQFQQTQSRLRGHQSNHFRTLVRERYQQMSRLANMVPALASLEDQGVAPADRMTDPGERLHLALESIGSLLDLEWDIRSVHWLALGEAPVALWLTDSEPLPDALIAAINKTPEQLTEQLQCDASHCRQYISSPILWHGETAGTLVLGRALGSILLTFKQLTGANLAIATPITTLDPDSSAQATTLRFQGATEPDIILPLLESQPTEALLASSSETPLAVHFGTHWYEIFHIDTSDAGLTAFVINRTTDERLGIRAIARNSLLIGLIGLLLAEVLLLLILRGPVERIRALSNLLPLLAENRFDALAERLPSTSGRLRWRDEIDTNVEVIGTLNQRMAIMQTEREAVQRELHWLADHDPLTSLLNRRRFDQEIAFAIEHADQTGTQGALLFIDLDNFKDVNDTSGHQAGDRLIKRIAKKLAAIVTPRGRIGRFGGDEFAVLINPADETELISLVKDIQHQIRSTSVRAGSHRHQVSASIGIVLFPRHGKDTQTLMANADLAMYQAKSKQHRGHWHLYSDTDMARAAANARVLWTREIGKALDESRFQLYFQPIMALPEGRIWRAETLLRLPLSDGRIANPAEFIPVAERTGLINAIDRWVMAAAIGVLAAHPQLSLAINLSAKALADPTLDGELMQLLQSSGINPQRLTLEITETVAIDNIDAAVVRMNALRALGCRFALDDFGSGFASYAYLKQLPVDDVKIDGSFIRDLADNTEDRIFVKSAADMAHAMGKKVIAEFVESQAIIDVLNELGVDFAQGYFIGRPVPELPATPDDPG
ncbi:bifunctional diguanylate cyclase/phosphodiesterase [Thiorhodovibrio frisius]|uniref:Diguanylate cyclase (GGDEF) domain-containing protein n=1 Tax=Thiorhodovibrio frisius TaxID=631362 RepID=H8YXJ3_9GAMM|nr:EAL domain-containing protein [Thiorhodovibrio frisius]EIC23169.1 diguanylate cyclase (GGDEF) domain-containing protein [Thiorhodovibrio frisius]WPL22560.1 Bacteriophytochrome cph2 [Thiorhodovibrio frisius]